MISIIIPSYNRGYSIGRTIQSVLNQTYSDYEIIVIEDGSKDETEEVLNSFNDDRIRYFRLKKNGGPGKARNYGVSLARGEYIAFLDSDDIWHDNKLERQLSFIENNECDVTFCRYSGVENERRWQFPEDGVEQEIFTAKDFVARNYASTQCIFGKKSVFKDICYSETLKTFQDWELMIRVADKYLVKYQKEILVDYEILPDSMSKNLEIIPPAMTEIIKSNQEVFDRYPDEKKKFLEFRQYFVNEVKRLEYIEKTPYGKYQKMQEKDKKGTYLFKYGKKKLHNKIKYRILSMLPNGYVSRYIDQKTDEDFKSLALELGLFNEKWYRHEYGDNSFDINHYLNEGYRLGYNPNPIFSSTLYMKEHKNVDFDKISPLEHFLKYDCRKKPYCYWNFSSSKEHKKIIEESEYFDEDYYLSQLSSKVSSASAHYLDIGYLQGLNPSKKFHNDAYLGTFYDLNINPLLHYEKYGRMEGRIVFDVETIEDFNRKLMNAGSGLSKTKEKNVLLITHELSITGAPRAALNLARRLKNLGYHVEVVSPADGPMRKEFEDNGFNVYINIYIFGRKDNDVFKAWKDYASGFDYIVYNSIVSAVSAHCLKDVDAKKIHWIHEGTCTFENGSDIFDYQNNTDCIDELYAVSEYSREICSKYTNKHMNILPYGIDDVTIEKKAANDKLTFIMAGSICTRKGHRVLLEALSLLDDKVHNKIRINVVGGCIEPELKKELLNSTYSCLNIVGEIKHDRLLEMLSDSDVLLCPSLDDPLPIICAEAMMLKKVVVVSDCSGTSSLINSGEDGIVINANNPKALAKAISKCLKMSEEERELMGNKARKIYEETFTMSCFDKQLKKIFGSVSEDEK